MYIYLPAFIRKLVLKLQILRGGVPAHEDGEEGDAGGGHPGQADHHHCSPHRDGCVVLERFCYCIVPIHRLVKHN